MACRISSMRNKSILLKIKSKQNKNSSCSRVSRLSDCWMKSCNFLKNRALVGPLTRTRGQKRVVYRIPRQRSDQQRVILTIRHRLIPWWPRLITNSQCWTLDCSHHLTNVTVARHMESQWIRSLLLLTRTASEEYRNLSPMPELKSLRKASLQGSIGSY